MAVAIFLFAFFISSASAGFLQTFGLMKEFLSIARDLYSPFLVSLIESKALPPSHLYNSIVNPVQSNPIQSACFGPLLSNMSTSFSLSLSLLGAAVRMRYVCGCCRELGVLSRCVLSYYLVCVNKMMALRRSIKTRGGALPTLPSCVFD